MIQSTDLNLTNGWHSYINTFAQECRLPYLNIGYKHLYVNRFENNYKVIASIHDLTYIETLDYSAKKNIIVLSLNFDQCKMILPRENYEKISAVVDSSPVITSKKTGKLLIKKSNKDINRLDSVYEKYNKLTESNFIAIYGDDHILLNLHHKYGNNEILDKIEFKTYFMTLFPNLEEKAVKEEMKLLIALGLIQMLDNEKGWKLIYTEEDIEKPF